MNFFNDDEKKGGAPVIPGAASPFRKTSAFGRAPLFSRAAGSIMDRFKNLSRKDMAFVGIGLSVLVMAPVAEYMMSKPAESTLLTGGFGDRRGGPSSLYEPGFGALSAGSSDGSGEVITPLSARDPASLILGSQPAAPVMPPAAAAPPSTSWRDSVKDAGREAFSAATKSAGAPTVIPKMQSAFRSLFGGGGSSGTTGTRGANGAIIADAKSASSKAAKRSMVGPVAMPGYKGVASNTPNSASKGAFEKLRAQADKSAGNFSGGSAMNSLDKAAADAVQLGAGSGGAGGLGDGDKTGKHANSSTKPYEHSRSGETLAEMIAKKRMEKALEWEFFKKYEIPKQIINAVVGEVSKWLAGEVGKALKGPAGPGAPASYCFPYANGSSGECRAEPLYPLSACDKEKGLSCDLSKCCKVGPKGAGTTAPGGDTGGNTGGNTGGDTGGDTGGNTGGHGGGANNGNAGSSNPAVAEVFGEFDATLTQMLQDVQKGVAETDAAKLLEVNLALTGGFTNLKANEVSARLKGAVTQTQGKEIAEYERNVRDAKMQFESAHSDYRIFKAKFDKVQAAAEAGTLVAAAADGHSVVIGAEVKPYITASLAVLEDFEKDEIVKAEQLIAFNEASLGVYKKQAGYVSTLADGVNQDYTGSVLVKSNELQTELQGIQTAIPQGGVIPVEKQTRIKEIFKAMSGIDSSLTIPSADPATIADPVVTSLPPADLRTAVGSSEEALISSPLTWRGVPKDPSNAVAGGKLNDADSVKAEGDAWKAATPKDKGTIANLADLNNLAEKCLLAGSMRARTEIPADVNASKLDPKAAADIMNPVLAKAEEIRKKLSDTWKIDMDNPTGSGAGGENPGGTPGAGNGTGVSNAATARADSALTDGTQRMALNQPVLDGISSKSNNCTSKECTDRLADARTSMVEMTKLQNDIQDLQKQAMQPGAKVAEIDAEIQQKQRELHAADQRFDEAAKRVAALEGYTPPKPPAQPTADQVAKQEDITKAAAHVRAIDACYNAVTGFKPKEAGRCEREVSTRQATIATISGRFRDEVNTNDTAKRTEYLGYLQNQRETAVQWAQSCLRTMPTSCAR